MYFIIENKYNWDREYFIAKVLRAAKRRILLYRTGARELALDQYLMKECNKPLKKMCVDLLSAIKFYRCDNMYTLKFVNKDIENIATFITFGNGVIQGSNILKDAFTWK